MSVCLCVFVCDFAVRLADARVTVTPDVVIFATVCVRVLHGCGGKEGMIRE
jgi:hypothetical protein